MEDTQYNQGDFIIPENKLFEPSSLLYDFFNIQMYVDKFSNQAYTLIKEDATLIDFSIQEAKPTLNDMVKEIQKDYNYKVFVQVEKKDKNGKVITAEEYFSSKHIKLDHLDIKFGKFEPHKPDQWEKENGSPYAFYNRYYNSPIMSLAKTDNKTIPSLFDKLISNLTSNDEEKFALINWLAYFYQTLRKSKVAWVIKGEKGIGKGILMNILRNIFGINYVYTESTAKSVIAQFNSHWKDKLFIVFEEVNFTGLKIGKEEIHGKLKDIITDGYINIEAKGKDMVTNYSFYSNLLFFSNKDNPIEVEVGDRRLNLLDCRTKLESHDWWVAGVGGTGDQLESKEIAQEIAQYFANYNCDPVLYDSLIKNDSRNEAIEANLANEEIFCKKLLDNNIEWFLDHSNLHREKQASGYTWASFVKNILFSKGCLYKGNIRVSKIQLKTLFEVMFDTEPNLKIFNKILGNTKQFTIKTKPIMCYTFLFKV